MHGRVSTDDAYVKAHSADISSRIWGTVIEVCVDDDDRVKEEQVLVRLDPRDYQTAVNSALALLNRREADVKRSEIRVDLIDSETQSRIAAAQAQVKKAKQEKEAKGHQIQEMHKKEAAAQADLTYARRENERY